MATSQVQPIASQSMENACTTSGVSQSASVHSMRCQVWRMTVPWQCSTSATQSRHWLLMTPCSRATSRKWPTAAACRGTELPPPEFVQTVVVDAEVVRDLVDDRDGDLVDDLRFGVAEVQQRSAVDRDGVRKRPRRVPTVALGQRDPLVEAEEAGFVGVAVLDQDDDVVERLRELRRDQVECVGDQLVKPLGAHLHSHRVTAPAVAAPATAVVAAPVAPARVAAGAVPVVAVAAVAP